ncbi:MAG: FG-GAP-like repeat-containing protein [Sphingomicrobium sp.]|nr:FG-GAP-like repeat-containing protein [Sphingomonadales bacterium]
MVDIPGDSSTTASLTVGSSATGSIEVAGDHDWFRISLTAGQQITVALSATDANGLSDAYLRIRDAAGNVLFENDDGGGNLNSRVSFSAPSSGIYFIDAGGYNDQATGDYQISVTPFTPPPVATPGEFADQLVSGYWGGDTHHFNVTQGGSISVNLTGLTPAGQVLARQALTTWSDIIGVRFAEVSTGGQITFDDNQTGAATDGSWSNGIITSEHVNIGTEWLTNYGTGINSYSYQSYLHEIGHALGLGHAGDYNNTATYPYDARFANDSWALSVMSYFDQRESSYFGNQGFSKVYLGTPMVVDILAASRLYGLSTTTRTGDTTYGYNSTAGNPVYDASLYPSLAYTVFDSGGSDTLDYSGSAANQRIDLNQGAFSNVNGKIGNVSIAYGTVIENAIGGSGGDTLVGNSTDNVLTGGLGRDTLIGGGGVDIFKDTAAGLNGDTISDFSRADRIVVTDAVAGSFSASLSGNTLTYTGGSLTLTSVPAGHVVFQASASGVQLTIVGSTVANDFNGDGRSDILWRNDNGSLSDWLGSGSGGFIVNDSALTGVPVNWHVAGTGDFNADGRVDILWRNDAGGLSDWLATDSGGFTPNDAVAFSQVATSWHVAGTGDFNNDGRDDILWRNDSGALSDWLGNGNGGFVANDAAAFAQVATSWHVAGTGDFNGDGRADILWRNDNGALSDWLGTANGGFAANDSAALMQAPTNWHIVATGDFNGDHRDDILWRNDNGTLSDWLATPNGGFTPNDAAAFTQVGTDWHVAATGDYNGDGRADILWRNDNGSLSDWLGTANGGFAVNDSAASSHVSTTWHVQAPEVSLI